jgi:hypothetical protein
LRYFSLGEITFTDISGNVLRDDKPSEFELTGAYAFRLAKKLSIGINGKFAYSNLTGGLTVGGVNTKAGVVGAADFSITYRNDDAKIGNTDGTYTFATTLNNLGNKVAYSELSERDFIPMNLKIGNNLTLELDDYNKLSFMVDFNKLLVPTPPEIQRDSTGSPVFGADGSLVLSAGKPSNVGSVAGLTQSFYDAPGGFNEELREVMWAVGLEYWYDNLFAFRTGYFHEAASKGNRQYFNIGAGLRYNVFGIDFAYLIPTVQQNPLQNTLRFTLTFNFESSKGGTTDKPAN